MKEIDLFRLGCCTVGEILTIKGEGPQRGCGWDFHFWDLRWGYQLVDGGAKDSLSPLGPLLKGPGPLSYILAHISRPRRYTQSTSLI